MPSVLLRPLPCDSHLDCTGSVERQKTTLIFLHSFPYIHSFNHTRFPYTHLLRPLIRISIQESLALFL